MKSFKPREHRPKAFKGGIISYQNFSISFDCVVRDQSKHGVKLKIEGEHLVPDLFHLTIPVDGLQAECEVRWRKDKLIGAAVIGEFSKDNRNARKQSLQSSFVAPRKSVLKKTSNRK